MAITTSKRMIGALVIIALGSIGILFFLHNPVTTQPLAARTETISLPAPSPTMTTSTATAAEPLQHNLPAVQDRALNTPPAAVPVASTAAQAPTNVAAPTIANIAGPTTNDSKASKPTKQHLTAPSVTKPIKLATKKLVAHFKKKVVLNPAWELRLGTFNNAGNANALVRRLRARGVAAAHTQSMPTRTGTAVRVVVGPLLTAAKAQALQQQLQTEMQLTGRLVTLNTLAPTQHH